MNILEIFGIIFGGLFAIIFGIVFFESVSCRFNQWKRERTRKHLKEKLKDHFERYWQSEEQWTNERVRDFAEDFYWCEWKKR